MKLRRTVFALFALAAGAGAQSYQISTIAGRLTKVGESATAVGLGFASALTIDSSGNIYIAVSDANRVYVVSPAGVITKIFGVGVSGFTGDGGNAANAKFCWPSGLALDNAGNLFIADECNSRIRKVAAGTDIIMTVAGSGSDPGDNIPAIGASFQPSNVALDRDGNLYIADLSAHRIRKVSASSGLITTVAGNGNSGYNGDNIPATSASLDMPWGLALDAAGNLYIGDRSARRVRKVTAATGIITTIAGNGDWIFNGDNIPATSASLYYPEGIAVDPAGNVYIADTVHRLVRKVLAANGLITIVAGTGNSGYNGDNIPATSASLAQPLALALDTTGNLYFADDRRTRKVTTAGIITTVAGNGTGAYNGDNIPAVSATLSRPWKVAVGPGGDLYIADSGNNRVRKVAAGSGVITTVAGNGDAVYNGDNIPATSAAVGQPIGIGFDSAGNLYISDSVNNRVRKVDAATASSARWRATETPSTMATVFRRQARPSRPRWAWSSIRPATSISARRCGYGR